MQIVRTRSELAHIRSGQSARVALVPTMGALHAGHLALVAAGQTRADWVVTSIFVNPTQFSSAEGTSNYPRTEDADIEQLRQAGCDAVWLPDADTIYPPGDCTMIEPSGPALDWEGTARPRHFRGMATVVAKLFGLVRPGIAVFGEKDWQQLQVVRRVVADLVLPVVIEPVATVREPDGLAMSSRNRFLTPAERILAPLLYQGLQRAAASGATPAALEAERTTLSAAGFTVEYLAHVDPATLRPLQSPGEGRIIAAARLGTVRLLDNIGVASSDPTQRT